MYEHKSSKVISRRYFAVRVFKIIGLTLPLIAASLFAGMCGYHYTEGFTWLDSLLNASMILGGMGPVDVLKTDAGKYFASFYSLYSGLFIIGMMGIILTPFIHRVMHKLHADK